MLLAIVDTWSADFKMGTKRLLLILGAVANAGVGFYIFGNVFCGTPIPLSTEVILLASVGVPIGILSGIVFKSANIQDIFLSMFPILGFFGLFVVGAVERGTGRDVAFAVGRLFIPLAIQGGLWFVSARLASRGMRKD